MRINIFHLLVLPLLVITACDTRIDLSPVDNSADAKGGIYHGIWGKQNLWLIAEAYGKSVQDLAIANKLKTPFDLGVGDRIFIPGVKKHVDIKFKDPAWDISLKSMSWPLDGESVCDCNPRSGGIAGTSFKGRLGGLSGGGFSAIRPNDHTSARLCACLNLWLS
jgi:hypothetical protein